MRTHDDFMRDVQTTETNTAFHRSANSPDTEDAPRLKKTRTIHPSTPICRDWMIVSGNVHYARDKASFTTYTPINVLVKNNIFSPHDEMLVSGIGSVNLTVPRSRSDPTPHTLTLGGVLHIPEALCNGFNPLLIGSSMSCHSEYWEGADRMGSPLWFGLPFVGLSRLVLADGSGESDLIEGREYTLSLYVSPQEKEMIVAQAQAQTQGGMM
ncbi:hypothetical protein BDV18DRAFT_12926 [Aspergillus unguis]